MKKNELKQQVAAAIQACLEKKAEERLWQLIDATLARGQTSLSE